MAKVNHRACQICGKTMRQDELVPAELVRPAIVAHFLPGHPDWSTQGFICRSDLNQFRTAYVRSLLEQEKGELTVIEHDVLESLKQHDILSADTVDSFLRNRTTGEVWADRIAAFGGSWRFILVFFGFMIVWMTINSIVLLARPFDPYPYILLNLLLSCLAAVQAPIIMMSQNRQEARDRLRSENDYRVNLKAELEIRHLHEKIDHILSRQWERLVEIQQIQIELMDELTKRRP